ncbi:MAG: hypothetical protein LBB10_01925 [Bifidobacteriaceae bacterium]|jgi:glutamate--cysteine ligase|nr:hypothetical protein [Bifidobacteriaceae bacterium]
MTLAPNKKHIASLVSYFESGIKLNTDKKIGLELEHFVVDKNGNSVSYFGTNSDSVYSDKAGVEKILQEMKPYFTEYEYENDYLIGMSNADAVISLEPGAQLEISISPCASAEEGFDLYKKVRLQIESVLEKRDYRLETFGYRKKEKAEDIDIIPKKRYKVFNELFVNDRAEGKKMMRGTASTQVSLDYFSELDAIDKFQHFFALGPIWALLFTNTPYFEGRENHEPLLRSDIWYHTDYQRAGIIKDVFDKGYSFEKYAALVDTTPLLVTESGNANGKSAAQVYPDRQLKKSEIEYIISNLFFDVRMKNFLELRTVDSLPEKDLLEFMTSVYSTIYNEKKYDAVKNLLGQLDFERVKTAKLDIIKNGFSAKPYGKSVSQFRDLLLH